MFASFNRHARACISRSAFLTFAAVVIAGSSAAAHDFWMEPSSFQPPVGKLVTMRLRVGQDMVGDPVPRDSALLDRFIQAAPSAGERVVPGRDGGDPAGVLRVDGPGLMIVGYQSKPSRIELAPDKFEQYLGEEGLDAIKLMRRANRSTSGSARELFSRCAKSLLSGGAAVPAQRDRALGFTLELVAERNPYTMGIGQEFPVRLLYQGKPQAGSLVIAINRLDPAAKLTARSDNQGRVVFRLPANGEWLVKAVHMIPAPADVQADWQSFWASLTFEIGLPSDSRVGTR